MAKFATLLNKPEDALDFEMRAARVKKAINTLLWNDEKGFYVDGIGSNHAALHSNMLPLAFDIVPESRKKSVGEFVKSRGMACSVYGSQFLMEALYNSGEQNYGLKLLTATNDRSWYNMIKVGSTITMEAWDMKYKPNSDWNHAWGAAPANIIPRCMWGIQPLKPAFEQFSIKPQLGYLKNSSIEVPTVKGVIKAQFQKSGKLVDIYTFEIPGNTVGKLFLEDVSNKEVTLNGQRANTGTDFILLEPGTNHVEVKINTF